MKTLQRNSDRNTELKHLAKTLRRNQHTSVAASGVTRP